MNDLLQAMGIALSLHAHGLHLAPDSGEINSYAIPHSYQQYRLYEERQHSSRDELRAVNEARARHGLPLLDIQ